MMRTYAALGPRTRMRLAVAARVGAALIAFLSVGCSFVGPIAIRSGRGAYNETIVATNNQQVLAMIVRMRYGEPSGLLAVSSVTANISIRADAGAEFGFGEDSDYRGNLVPLSIGFGYEENPTISYSPVQGDRYMRQMLSPLPLDIAVLLIQALHGSTTVTTLLIRSVNGIRNPDFVVDPNTAADARFARIAERIADLARQGRITWTHEARETERYALVIAADAGAADAEIADLFDALGFAAPPVRQGVIRLPVELGLGAPVEPSLVLETRSLFDLFNIAAAAVDVPTEHLDTGIAHPLPTVGAAGQQIRIQSSKRSPKRAMVAIRHHDWWYSIDGADALSKTAFRILESLISVRIADSVDRGATTPVLTVPVSR